MNAATTAEARNGLPVHTYAEPLSGLRVSWGAILAGAVALLSISMILFALALAIILTVTHATGPAMRGAGIAVGVCAIVTTLIGSVSGGWFAGYLPGNGNRLIAAGHAFLAWGIAFLVATLFQLSTIGGIATTSTMAAVNTIGTTVQTTGSTASAGQAPMDQKAIGLLRSLGYSEHEAAQMVTQSRGEAQRMLRNPGAQGPTVDMRGTAETAMGWAAGFSWAWFGTWALSALLAIAGGLIAARRHTRPEEFVEVPPAAPPVVPQSEPFPPATPAPV